MFGAGHDGGVEATGSAKNRSGKRLMMRIVVWLTFVWIAVMAGFFIWSAKTHNDTERKAPELVAAVDDAMSSASRQNPELVNTLVRTNVIQSVVGPSATDVFSLVPVVQGAEAFRFSVDTDGAAVVGYRGTGLASDVCVRSVLALSGVVTTQRWSCSAW